jgi:hypothetical protein
MRSRNQISSGKANPYRKTRRRIGDRWNDKSSKPNKIGGQALAFMPRWRALFDQPQAMVVGVVLHLTHQIEMPGGNHGRHILKRKGRARGAGCGKAAHTAGFPLSHNHDGGDSLPAGPHQQQFRLFLPLLTQTPQPRQGDTMCAGSSTFITELTSLSHSG